MKRIFKPIRHQMADDLADKLTEQLKRTWPATA